MRKPSADGVNRLNIALMAASCCAAIVAPFHLFLLAYAVLGPLHYLTEISWLHDRQYFTPRSFFRRGWLLLVIAAILAVAIGYVSSEVLHRPVSPHVEISLVALAFVGAAVGVFVAYRVNAVAVLLVAMAAIALLVDDQRFAVAAYLLVTIVHVLIFTGCFILFGAAKARSRSGYLSFAIFCSCIALTLSVTGSSFQAGQTARLAYSSFEQLNMVLLRLTGSRGASVYEWSGRHVMQLISFAYTYHYLNWFSKTSVIGWHEVSKRRATSIIMLWLAGLAVYAYDFRIGFAVLYVLGVLHVLLEFPLNHQTIAGLLRSVRLPARLWLERASPGYSRRLHTSVD